MSTARSLLPVPYQRLGSSVIFFSVYLSPVK